jgi:rubrerythrin
MSINALGHKRNNQKQEVSMSKGNQSQKSWLWPRHLSPLVTLILAVSWAGTIASAQGLPRKSVEPSVTLSADERWALNEAIQDEYKARAIYAKVIARFGEVRPFSNIIHAEMRHIEALARIYAAHNLPVPEDTWYARVPSFNSLEDACAAAVQAEIDNAALYDQIMLVVGNAEMRRVFTALAKASIEQHLPAFQRYLDRSSGRSVGRGQGGNGQGYGRGGGNGQGGGQGYGRGDGRGQGGGQDYGRGQGGGGNGQGGGQGYGRGGGNGQGGGQGYGRGGGNGQGGGQGYGRGGGNGQGRGYGLAAPQY